MSEEVKASTPSSKQEKPEVTSKGKKRSLWQKSKLGLLILLILGALSLYSAKRFGEYGASQMRTEYVVLESAELAAAAPLRIALIADIHSNASMFANAAYEIKKHKPDIIVVAGDIIDAQGRFRRSRWFIQQFENLLKIAPTYVILGNHDMEKMDELARVIEKSKVTLLRNEAITWTSPSGKDIRIIGLGDWNEYDEDPAACMKAVGEEELPVILLSHDPESRWLLRNYDWDLMLSGHTHGGQLANPLTGEYISLRSSMPAGLFDFEGNRQVYVTRGIGAIFGMRFFCPAEVTIIDIK